MTTLHVTKYLARSSSLSLLTALMYRYFTCTCTIDADKIDLAIYRARMSNALTAVRHQRSRAPAKLIINEREGRSGLNLQRGADELPRGAGSIGLLKE